ncbi:MAG: hypothetical protein IKX97_08210, partial [Erysipelotrichaceae bacterium]|nr:hypothetical protein [Erysipelotrichaceae bacterium]
LLKKQKDMLTANFVEGMACSGGCIGGAGNLMAFTKKKENIDSYANKSSIKTIEESVKDR